MKVKTLVCKEQVGSKFKHASVSIKQTKLAKKSTEPTFVFLMFETGHLFGVHVEGVVQLSDSCSLQSSFVLPEVNVFLR